MPCPHSSCLRRQASRFWAEAGILLLPAREGGGGSDEVGGGALLSPSAGVDPPTQAFLALGGPIKSAHGELKKFPEPAALYRV
jgi:hypothetical protein